MRVIPVAGNDSMLLNLSGAHAPFFTRNVVVLTDDAGHTGAGEVPGGAQIRQVLEDASSSVVDRAIASYNEILQTIRQRFGDRDTAGRGLQTFDMRVTVHAVTAVECALLDLMGQWVGLPVAALLGEGRQRSSVPVLGYLFFVGDRRKTDLPYASDPDAVDPWLRLRHEEALTHRGRAYAWPRRRKHATAFTTSSSKAVCWPGSRRWKPSRHLRKGFPRLASRSIPTARGP